MSERGVRLDVKKLKKIARAKGLMRLCEISDAIGVHRSQIWRYSLPTNHKEYSSPRGRVIAKILDSFDASFEDVFFLEEIVANTQHPKEAL
ncbi:hypothetical protein [Shouchella lonarensis]|uniref:Cro/C1-type HTH DNA-binding domain-containing protein n=1 Tax=Shouchella lonarensis TaxID=1464122 RepID=A0A1G6IKK7_9BACI|nr:hypothetical protein [Shouchella lonarensis]SDC07122.1 hypothetical protein SAMN05421737_10598 [Shouchella lonarensis]